MHSVLAIALGGALGAVGRHYMNIFVSMNAKMAFPVGTLGVNVLGSFLMGVLIAVFAQYWQPPQEVKLFLVTGFLGGFTTFSTFSLDVMTLYSRGATLEAAAYIGASVLISIAAIFAGHSLAGRMF